ncbi:hypothetical protein CHISP_3399 [Chitinispirillum alkaliphilum]|nr:hypothetical protein CHISP_3399 [Chitinispirillum alkaliphilum]
MEHNGFLEFSFRRCTQIMGMKTVIRILVSLNIIILNIWSCGMDEMNDQSAGPFGFYGEQYWDPTAIRNDLSSQMHSKNKGGLVIDPPPEVFLDNHSTAPAHCLRLVEKFKRRKYSLSTTTQVVSVHLETGAVKVRKLAPYPPPRLPDKSPPEPGWFTEYVTADLMETSSIQSDLGSNKLFLLCGPEISNQATTKIVPGKRGFRYKEYREIVDTRYNIQNPYPITGSIHTLDIQRLTPPEPDKENTLWEISSLKEEEKDYRITVKFNIIGINRFLFPEEIRPFDNMNNTVFASIPLAIIIFDQDRNTVLTRQFGIPVTEEPVIDKGTVWLRGSVSFLLSKLVEPEQFQYLYTWFICMDNIQLLEIELEEGWEDDLVPPPIPVPKIVPGSPEE